MNSSNFQKVGERRKCCIRKKLRLRENCFYYGIFLFRLFIYLFIYSHSHYKTIKAEGVKFFSQHHQFLLFSCRLWALHWDSSVTAWSPDQRRWILLSCYLVAQVSSHKSFRVFGSLSTTAESGVSLKQSLVAKIWSLQWWKGKLKTSSGDMEVLCL